MLPSLLITFREVLEASLIVATILGILSKIGQKSEIATVWTATVLAGLVSVSIIFISSVFGFNLANTYKGSIEETIEGALMIVSAIFITWAVFFLHTHFGKHKTRYLASLKSTIEKQEKRGLFILVFTAVFREGFEIILFLSTLYFSSNPTEILSGFTVGFVLALALSLGLFSATVRMPVFWAFRTTSIMLILFAGGLLARGVHEFAEVGVIPEFSKITIWLLPQHTSVAGDIIKGVFGITRTMDILQIASYTLYTSAMFWWVFFRKTNHEDIVQTS